MNFSTLKGLTIPEGVVKQIADASGRVLWSAVKIATIALSGTPSDLSYAIIDGIKYDSPNNLPSSLTVPSKTVITLYASRNGTSITLNGNASLFFGEQSLGYCVTENAYLVFKRGEDFSPKGGTKPYGAIEITDPNCVWFVVGSKRFLFPSGMTWAEFCDIGIADGFYVVGSDVFGEIYGNSGQVYDDANAVKSTDLILSEHEYKFNR